jgi:hypothetical protein
MTGKAIRSSCGYRFGFPGLFQPQVSESYGRQRGAKWCVSVLVVLLRVVVE